MLEKQHLQDSLVQNKIYEITEEEANYLESNQDNELSPYFIQYIEVQLGKKKTLTPTGGRPGGNGNNGNNGNGDEPYGNEQRPGPNPPHPTGENGSNGNNGNGDEPYGNEQRPKPTTSNRRKWK